MFLPPAVSRSNSRTRATASASILVRVNQNFALREVRHFNGDGKITLAFLQSTQRMNRSLATQRPLDGKMSSTLLNQTHPGNKHRCGHLLAIL